MRPPVTTIRQCAQLAKQASTPKPPVNAIGRKWQPVKADQPQVKMICGVRIVLDKDGKPILH